MIEPDLLQQGITRPLSFSPATIALVTPSGSSSTSMPCSMSLLRRLDEIAFGEVDERPPAEAGVGHDADGMAHRQGRVHGVLEPPLHLPHVAAGAAVVDDRRPLVDGDLRLPEDRLHVRLRRGRADDAGEFGPEVLPDADRPHPPLRGDDQRLAGGAGRGEGLDGHLLPAGDLGYFTREG